MSVYVKGMQMPYICMSCEFCGYIDNRYSYCTRLPMRGEVSIGEPRPEWCPLVGVPPHGRLIDADAMERLMSDIVQGDIRGYPYSDTLWDTAFRWLDSQPTIITAGEDNNG